MINILFRFSSAIIFPAIAAIALFTAANAQDVPDQMPAHIRTTGEATVTATPDRVRIDVGVVTQSESSATAVSQNAEKLAATLAELRKLLGRDADIKTISYVVAPVYRYPREGGEPSITGYTATNIVRVTLDDLAKTGSVIDTAARTGSNRIQNLQFLLKDEAAASARALREAALQARSKANALASALGVKILGIHSVTESSAPSYPVRDMAFARAEAASTPIEPGTIEVRATVSLVVKIGQ
jgi:uncharacterized protein